MIHIQTGSEKVPAAYRTLPAAWYPRNQNRAASLRMAGTPAYASGHIKYPSIDEERQAVHHCRSSLVETRQLQSTGQALDELRVWMPATVSVCIAAQDDLLRGLYDPCNQHKVEHRSLIARLYRKKSHGKTWLAPTF